ncbi:uncharacterized protein EDB91DRAFT_1144804 [Suillus paluster]|uniref:uncharacterized protein n=1 Tax=Suillus paluster TaxID=48578 RepID=UPI001B87A0B1|nr:uncharacterized protein EDB91DRAFT_1144804 [Suillus paluster]KAG1735308.1 hypothetical protein EDB91DRAFT_1144804 [Suillus paluster]
MTPNWLLVQCSALSLRVIGILHGSKMMPDTHTFCNNIVAARCRSLLMMLWLSSPTHACGCGSKVQRRKYIVTVVVRLFCLRNGRDPRWPTQIIHKLSSPVNGATSCHTAVGHIRMHKSCTYNIYKHLETMSLSWNGTKRPKRDEVTKWHDSTNVILDYCQDYLEYGSTTDHVQRSSLGDMNDALLADTHLSYDERLAEAQKCNYRAQYLSTKLQILFHRENGSDYKSWARRYAVLHEKGYGARTDAADQVAATDRYLATIDPRTFVISRTSHFR